MSDLYAPHILAPDSGVFNRGRVEIEWIRPEFPSQDESIDTSEVTYEIEYTDVYKAEDTVWRSIKKRIPYSQSSYTWVVGKMIKSSTVKVRMRTKSRATEEYSDWAISEQFSVNVFDLVPPVILSPVPNKIYNSYILIILDESLIRETFNQKVRYYFDYASEKLNLDWTTIAEKVPVGNNIVRWNTALLLPSDDYVLRMTVRNSSTCPTTAAETSDQISVRYIYGLTIRHPGVFIIDTKPPKAHLSIEGVNGGVTNKTNHILNLYASDETTKVETVRIRDCDADSVIPLGETGLQSPAVPCPIDSLLASKELSYAPRIKYRLSEDSGFKKIEAIFKDSGGNLSISDSLRVFISLFRSTDDVSDVIIRQESRDKVDLQILNNVPIAVTETAIYEVAYVSTAGGELWCLDPYPSLLFTLPNPIVKLCDFNGYIFAFTHTETTLNGAQTDISRAYINNNGDYQAISSDSDFTGDLSIVSCVSVFGDNMFVGMKNGKLWKYTGTSWSNVTTFDSSISSLSSDERFLFIGLANSDDIILYNNTTLYQLGTD